jgi:hypothetical protein
MINDLRVEAFRLVILSPFASLRINSAKNLMRTLHGACPEGDSSVATLLQNDRKRRVQDDKGM